MVEQTHELRLKIDAAAAEAGAKRFTAATNAVRKAVQDLDREADGTFSKLARHKPQFDVTPLTRASNEAAKLSTAIGGTTSASDRAAASIRTLALQSANALRVSTDQASRLRDRLLSLDDSASLSRLDAGLAKLRSGLIAATSGIDVREARAGYAGLASELNRTAREAERLRAITNAETLSQEEAARAAAQHSASLESLRARYDSVFAVSRQYENALRDIQTLEDAGAVSAMRAAQMRDTAAQSMLAAGAANDRFAVSAGQARAAAQQMGYQVNDVITMAALGASPMQVISSQIFQISQAMDMAGGKAAALGSVKTALLGLLNPTTLAVGAVIGLTTALVQWGISALGASESTMTFGEALSDADSKISAITRSTDTLANAKLGSLAEGYGRVNEELRIHLERLAQIAQLEAVSANRNTIQALEDSMTGGWLTTDVDDIRIALDTTNDGARHFLYLLDQIKQARTFEEQATAISTARKYLESTGITLDNAEGSAQAMLMGLIKAEDSALRLKNAASESDSAIAGAVSQTAAWASAMSGVRSEINAILSSLSAISGGVISNAAKSAELTALQAGKTVRQAEVARLRYENEQKLGARQMAADAKGGVAGWAESMLIKGERAVWERGISLDDQLTAEREKARKRETTTTGGGGGGGGKNRTEALGDESRSLAKLSKDMNTRIFDLGRENDALRLLISGQASTMEGAQMLADAQKMGGGAIDEQTAAIVRQYEEAVKLNAALQRAARDPVKEWMDSVPNWLEAGKQIEMGAIESLKSSISEFIKTGKMDFESLGEAILASFAEVVSDKAVKELMGLLGQKDGSFLSGLFADLGFSSMGDPDLSGLATGAGQAGSTIATSMVQAGQQVSQQIAAAMTGAGSQAGAAVRSGVQTGGVVAGTNIRTAGTQAGTTLGQGVVAGAQQGAPILAAGVASGASGGSAGGGILDSLGGWQGIAGMVLGAFSEGGYVTQPVGSGSASMLDFMNAPHFSEGGLTPGSVPVIAHENEAIVPLSRGRSIPVELAGSAGGGNTVQNIYMTVNGVTDADSFRRSRGQVESDLARAGQRSLGKNG